MDAVEGSYSMPWYITCLVCVETVRNVCFSCSFMVMVWEYHEYVRCMCVCVFVSWGASVVLV